MTCTVLCVKIANLYLTYLDVYNEYYGPAEVFLSYPEVQLLFLSTSQQYLKKKKKRVTAL